MRNGPRSPDAGLILAVVVINPGTGTPGNLVFDCVGNSIDEDSDHLGYAYHQRSRHLRCCSYHSPRSPTIHHRVGEQNKASIEGSVEQNLSIHQFTIENTGTYVRDLFIRSLQP